MLVDPDTVIAAALERALDGDIAAASQLASALLVARPASSAQALARALDAVNRMYQGQYHEALPQVLPLLEEIERSSYADRIDWLYTAIGYALGSLGDPERGLEWTARALAVTDTQPHSVGRRKAFSAQGTLLSMLGEHDLAMQALQRALLIAQEQGALRAQAVCLGNLSFACIDRAWSLGDFAPCPACQPLAEQALEFADRAEAIANAHGIALMSGFAANNRGFALLLLGQSQQACQVLQAAELLTRAHPHIHVDVLFGLSMAHRQLGDFEAARTRLAAAEEAARAGHFERNLNRVLEEGIRLEHAAGAPAAALGWARRYIDFLRQHYANRLKTLAHGAELFAEVERARREAAGLRAQSKAWEDVALHDALTGALNRVGLARHVDAGLQDGRPMALAVFDADHFKLVNDRFGHSVGDAVLRQLVQLIRTHSRTADALARVGGEEFVLLLPDATPDVALLSCERIRQAIALHDWGSTAPGLQVTASIGVAGRQGGEPFDALLARADVALYAAKHGGRNRVCVAA